MKNNLLPIIFAGSILCIQQVTTGPLEPKCYINIPACALVRNATTPPAQGYTSQFPIAVQQAKRHNALLKQQAARLELEQRLQEGGVMPYHSPKKASHSNPYVSSR